MPRGRRRKKAEEEDSEKEDEVDGAAAKRTRSSASQDASTSVAGSSTSCTSLVWEWKGDNGWEAFSKEHQDALSTAFRSDKKRLQLSVPGTSVKLAVNLQRMVQANASTGWERGVRCRDSNDDGNAFWEWQNEHSKWNAYLPEVSRLLECALAHDKTSQAIAAAGRSYTVHFGQRMEQVNDSTSVARPIRRCGKLSASTPTTADTTSKTVKSEPSSSKAKSAAGKGKSSKSSTAASSDTTASAIRTVEFSGKAPVDDKCSVRNSTHVYYEGSDVWDCMLNQTNLANNNNKFYIIQLLESANSKKYYVWMRWGRVGLPGQNSLFTCSDLDHAKTIFRKKFSDKTRNQWEDRENFEKVPGKYDLLFIDYSAPDEDETDAPVPQPELPKPSKPPESNLPKSVAALVELICNVKAMEEVVVEMKYDTKKAPLGKLTKEQVAAGYSALKKIEACLNEGHTGRRLVEACDAFYTRVPHCFGMMRPPLINTLELVKQKVALLETLGDIEIAMKVIGGSSSSTENPVDRHYRLLNCGLDPLGSDVEEFQMIEKYVQNTHARTHNQYKLKVLDVFKVDRKTGGKFKDVGNCKLLWHGSRLTNWVGILSQGLRIAPPEAPVTGYMFGKGVYFADMSSKSANYCFASQGKNIGLLVLCKVALGKTNDLLGADYNADKLPSGKHSVKGLGQVAPDPSQSVTLPDGCEVPLGCGKDTGVKNPHGYTLNYNEFIVYDTSQIEMRYLVQVHFDFK